MKEKITARTSAVMILNRILEDDSYGNIELSRELTKLSLELRDKGLVTEIVNGTLRNMTKIDFILAKFVEGKTVELAVQNILRAAIYQIYFLDKIPISAAVNEAVESAKILANSGAAKFVNGVLRNVERKYAEIEFPKKGDGVSDFLALEYSYPKWMVDLWLERFGIEFTEELLEAGNERPMVSLRINSMKTDRETLMKMLEEQEIEAEEGEWSPLSIKIKGGASIDKLKGFREGLFTVQDEASMMAVIALDPKAGDRVADLCCAPGGKSTFILEKTNCEVQLIAGDVHQHKLKLVEDGFKRLGLKNYTLKLWDVLKFDDSMRNRFDKIILDAPCSGFGVIRKKPDMKIRKKQSEIKELVEIQKKMLVNAAKYLKKGGLLIYSTCTISLEENEDMVKWAVEGNNNLKFESLKGKLPQTMVDADGMAKLYPNVHHTDGFFIAALRKY